MEIQLSQKYNFDGVETDKLELNFDKLTGRTLVQLEKEFKKENKGEFMLIANNAFSAKVAAYCADIREDDILDMSAKDFTSITGEVTIFLNS